MASNFIEGLSVTVIGMLTVFAVLILLWMVLELMRVFFYKPKKQSNKSVESVKIEPEQTIQPEQPNNIDDSQLVAVIMASIACSLNTSTYNLKIKTLKRIEQSGPVWNRVGRNELIDSRQLY